MKPLYGTGVAHPSPFFDRLLPVLAASFTRAHWSVLDPFAAVGRIHQLRKLVDWPLETIGVEIEPKWANLHPDTLVGNAKALPFPYGSFDAIVTCLTYANGLADDHNAQDGSLRRSYTHDLGRPLHPDNSGSLQWG